MLQILIADALHQFYNSDINLHFLHALVSRCPGSGCEPRTELHTFDVRARYHMHHTTVALPVHAMYVCSRN